MFLLSQKSEKLFCLKSPSEKIRFLLQDFFQDSFFYVLGQEKNEILFHLAVLRSFLDYAKNHNLLLLIEKGLQDKIDSNTLMTINQEFNLRPYNYQTVPYKHQIEAYNFFDSLKFGALFDEMGLGKTKVFIDLCSNWLKEDQITNILVICPKALIYTWQKEIQKHSNITSIATIQGNKIDRQELLKENQIFNIINYELLLRDFDWLKKQAFSVIILDEAHKIKNPKAKVTKCIHKLQTDFRFIMTGTPICNKIEDLWSLLFFIRPTIFKNQSKFLNSFCNFETKEFYVKSKNKQKPGRKYKVRVVKSYKNLDILKTYLSSISLRRLKEDCLDLPQKIYQNIYLDLLPEQQQYYNDYRDSLRSSLINTDSNEITLQNQLTKIIRLRQITSSLITISDQDISVKYLALDELLSEILYDDSLNTKVVIWSHFIKTLLALNSRYEQYKPILYYGATKNKKQAENDFLSKPAHKLFIANPQVAGLGLNLIAAQIAIYVDKSFSYMLWSQSQDRIHRIGISKSPQIISLIARNTIDEHLENILQQKQSLTDYMIDNKLKPKSFLLKLLS